MDSKVLETAMDIFELATEILDSFSGSLSAGGGSLYLREGKRLLLLKTLEDRHQPLTIDLPLRSGSVFDRAWRKKRPLLIEDIENERNLKPSGWRGYSSGTSIIFPMVDDADEVCGLISLHNKKEAGFTRRDMELGSTLAKHAMTVVRQSESNRRMAARINELSKINERLRDEMAEYRRVEIKQEKEFEETKRSHDAHLSTLDMLRLGILTVDGDGRVTFINQSARKLIGMSRKAALGKRWNQLLSFHPDDRAWLGDVLEGKARTRTRARTHVESRKGRRFCLDIEALDDPKDEKRKIIVFYDMTEVYDLRFMLHEKAQFHELRGKSKGMRSVYRRIQEVSGVDWTVLIEGETGTGKELAARAIHSSSARSEKPFIPVNCAGLTDSLLTSQLFGHKRGAFTGATEDQKGFFETADGGTLFLDEIGDISGKMQTNLLRVLEEKKIIRLGESRERKVDVRVLVATNRDLDREVEKGRFRRDLLYRIRVARIKLPALRERREDIPLLVESFLSQSRAATGKPVENVSKEAMNLLLKYDWPGNVRELKSAIDFATLHSRDLIIHAEDLPPELESSEHPARSDRDEKRKILAALRNTNGNRLLAARELGMSRSTFYRHLARFGLTPAEIQSQF